MGKITKIVEANETEIAEMKNTRKKIRHAQLVHAKTKRWQNRRRYEDGGGEKTPYRWEKDSELSA